MAYERRTYFVAINAAVLFLVLIVLSSGADNTIASTNQPEIIKPPSNLTVAVQLNPEGKSVTAIFRGGQGQTLLNEIVMEIIRPDGYTESKSLGNVIGEAVILNGSGCGDNVKGTAYFKNGMEYLFLNEKMQYLKDLCPADYQPAIDPCQEISTSQYLKTEPIDIIPANKTAAIQVNVDIGTIDVQFRGGSGQDIIKTIKVTQIGPDGSEETKTLINLVGDNVTFPATNKCMDRLTVDVIYLDGTEYHVYDSVLHYKGLI